MRTQPETISVTFLSQELKAIFASLHVSMQILKLNNTSGEKSHFALSRSDAISLFSDAGYKIASVHDADKLAAAYEVDLTPDQVACILASLDDSIEEIRDLTADEVAIAAKIEECELNWAEDQLSDFNNSVKTARQKIVRSIKAQVGVDFEVE